MSAAHTRELAHRTGDGIEVSLRWSRRTDSVTVVVGDLRTGASFDFAAPSDRALDAFYHPFAYAPEDAALDALARRGPVHA